MPKAMPDIDGFRFFFYSNENAEPPHIHVSKGDGEAKFWLEVPVRLQDQRGFKSQDVRQARRLVEQYRETLLRAWNDHFGN